MRYAFIQKLNRRKGQRRKWDVPGNLRLLNRVKAEQMSVPRLSSRKAIAIIKDKFSEYRHMSVDSLYSRWKCANAKNARIRAPRAPLDPLQSQGWNFTDLPF